MTSAAQTDGGTAVDFKRYVLVLGLCTALGPFAIDMYLPGLSRLSADLGVEGGSAQYTLTAFFVALAVGQLIYGPVSDVIGRRGPMLFGTGLFVLGSIGCALTSSLEWLVVCRFVQGLGGAAGGVLARAVARDLFSGERMARLFALTLLVLGVSPILAPVAGSFVVTYASWRVIFLIVGAIGLFGLVCVMFLLPESHTREARKGASVGAAFASYGRLLVDGWFLTSTLTGGFAMAAFFAYLGASPEVYVDHFGVTPLGYGLIFAANASVFIGGAQFNVWLARRVGMVRMIGWSTAMMLAGFLLLGGVALFGTLDLWTTVGLVMLGNLSMGFLVPPSSVLVLEPYGRIAGAASALMGTIHITLGTISTVLTTLFFDGTARPMGLVMAGFALLSMASWLGFLAVRRRRPHRE